VAACVPAPAVVVWGASTGREVLRVPAGQDGWPTVTAACISPDARTLALEADGGSVTLWELAARKQRARLGAAQARKADPAPAPAVSNQVGLIRPAPFRPAAEALAYSPDGRFLAQVMGRGVRLWDVVARKERGRLEGHFGYVAALAYAPDGRTLVTGGTDGTGLVWDVAKLTEPATRPPGDDKAEALAAAWQALAGSDAVKAFDGVSMLVAAPGQAVPLLRDHVKPAAAPNEKDLAGWIAGLDSDDFAVRREAAASLRRVGSTAGPALRKVLATDPSAEARRQIEALLADMDQASLTGDDLRAARAVEALEMIGSAEAREILKWLAGGAPGAPATEAAKAALERLGKTR
jgi:hypothetical protein